MKLSVLTLLCVVSVGAAASAGASLLRGPLHQKGQSKPSHVAWFEGELAAARKESRERGVALLIFAVLEDEEASDRFRDQLRSDPKRYAALTQGTVALIVNNGTHPLVERTFEEDGEKVQRKVCEAYLTRDCSVHKGNWDRIYQEFVLDDDPEGAWMLPEVIAIQPDGEIGDRLQDGEPPSFDDIEYALENIVEKFGKGLSREELVEVKTLLARGHAKAGAGEVAEAWHAFSGVLALAEQGPFADEARTAREPLGAKLEAAVSAAVDKVEAGEVREGFRELLELEQSLAGTPAEEAARKAIKLIERDKEHREDVEAVKTEIAAEEIWTEVEALLAQDEERKALRLAKKLMSKRFRDTPSAQKALERFPELGEG